MILQSKFKNSPSEGPYNHAWVTGDSGMFTIGMQSQIEETLGISQHQVMIFNLDIRLVLISNDVEYGNNIQAGVGENRLPAFPIAISCRTL